MKRKIYRFLSLVCVFALLLALLMPAFAAGEEAGGTGGTTTDGTEAADPDDTGDGGADENDGQDTPPQETHYAFSEDGTTLTIQKGFAETEWEAVRQENKENLTIVHFEEGAAVTKIGASAFSDCENLTEIALPETVASIESFAFANCESLTSVSIPDGVKTIGESAFSNCWGLKEVKLPADLITIEKAAFSHCTYLSEIVIPDRVTEIGDAAFSTCFNANKLVLGSRVKIIGKNAFEKCRNIPEVVIPDSVTEIRDSAFEGCTGMQSLSVGMRVSNIGEKAFANCSNLKEIVFTGEAPSVQKDAFKGVSKATLNCPDSWSTDDRSQLEIETPGTSTTDPSDPEDPDDPGNTGDPNDPDDPGGSGSSGGKYTITYHTADGSTYSVTVQSGESIVINSVPEGYAGWSTKEGSTIPSFLPGDRVTPSGNMTLYLVRKGDAEAAFVESDYPNWLTNHAGAWKHVEADGTPSVGSRWLEDEGHRYLFDENGILQLGNSAGDVLLNGNLYYITPDRNLDDPRTCFAVCDYVRARANVGITYYNSDGISYVGWLNAGEGKRYYQTRIRQNGKEDIYIYVWRGQIIPESVDPDHPHDPAYNIPAGRYLFGEDGLLVQKRGWYECKDGHTYFVNDKGQILLDV